jgi:hypothetical protein
MQSRPARLSVEEVWVVEVVVWVEEEVWVVSRSEGAGVTSEEVDGQTTSSTIRHVLRRCESTSAAWALASTALEMELELAMRRMNDLHSRATRGDGRRIHFSTPRVPNFDTQMSDSCFHTHTANRTIKANTQRVRVTALLTFCILLCMKNLG